MACNNELAALALLKTALYLDYKHLSNMSQACKLWDKVVSSEWYGEKLWKAQCKIHWVLDELPDG